MSALYVSLACLAQVWIIGPFAWFPQAVRETDGGPS